MREMLRLTLLLWYFTDMETDWSFNSQTCGFLAYFLCWLETWPYRPETWLEICLYKDLKLTRYDIRDLHRYLVHLRSKTANVFIRPTPEHLFYDHVKTLLIKVSTTVTVYRGHCCTLFFLPGIISLFIMCIGIIWNNSLVGGLAQAEVWTWLLSASRFTAHGARVLWPLGYMDRSCNTGIGCLITGFA